MTAGAVRRCARCSLPTFHEGRHWPDGRICGDCYAAAMRTYASCSGCGQHRLTPGLAPDGSPLCPPCAGIRDHCACERCGRETFLPFGRRTCQHCVLDERLAALLDDGTGRIRPELVPFHAWICRTEQPSRGISWTAKPHVPPILAALARGRVPLTHDGLSTLSPHQSVIHVRDLLMACGVLPPADRFLILFEQWLADWLDTIADDAHRSLLQQFSSWHVLRRLRDIARKGPVGYGRNQVERHKLRQSAFFLTWLADRGRAPADCTQADADAFFARPGTAPAAAIPFIRWCITRREMPGLHISARTSHAMAPVSQRERLDVIRRLAEDDGTLDLRDRVVALLILLYAQPVTKIVTLTTNDITREDGTMLIRLGDPPAPVPEPFAALIAEYASSRPNRDTAANPGSSLLFPGIRAGQPFHPTTLRLRLNAAGIPNITGRTAALRDLLLEAPAPIVASMLGYNAQHIEYATAAAGTTWKDYAPGDHSR